MPDVVAIDRESDITMPRKGPAKKKGDAAPAGDTALYGDKSAESTAADLSEMAPDATFNAPSSANSTFNVEGSHTAAPVAVVEQPVTPVAVVEPANASKVVAMRAFIRNTGGRALVALGLYMLHKHYRKTFNELFRGRDTLSAVGSCFALYFGLKHLSE